MGEDAAIEAKRIVDFMNSDGRELVNFKFWPGTSPDLTPAAALRACRLVLEDVMSRRLVNNPPRTGLPQRHVSELIASYTRRNAEDIHD